MPTRTLGWVIFLVTLLPGLLLPGLIIPIGAVAAIAAFAVSFGSGEDHIRQAAKTVGISVSLSLLVLVFVVVTVLFTATTTAV